MRGDPNSLTFSFDGAINGTCVDILVDSGAYLSFLSEEFYREHLAATKQQATTDVPVTLADGTPYRVNTVVRTKLRINQPYEHPYETVVQLHVLPMRGWVDGACRRVLPLWVSDFGSEAGFGRVSRSRLGNA